MYVCCIPVVVITLSSNTEESSGKNNRQLITASFSILRSPLVKGFECLAEVPTVGGTRGEASH